MMSNSRTRTASRVGLVAAAAVSLVLGSAGLASASTGVPRPATSHVPPASTGFVVHADRLVLSYEAPRYVGTLRLVVRNTARVPVDSYTVGINVPVGLRFTGMDAVCGLGGDTLWYCWPSGFAAGQTKVLTVNFSSYAGPENFARITASDTVVVSQTFKTPGPRESVRYAGILRSVSGSLRAPRPYQPSTQHDLALAATGSPVVTGDASGEVQVRVPLAAQARTDAPNDGAEFMVTVAGIGYVYPTVDPPKACTLSCPLPGPGWLALGETQPFALMFSLPAGTPAGSYPVTVVGTMRQLPGQTAVELTPENNVVAFTLVIPA